MNLLKTFNNLKIGAKLIVAMVGVGVMDMVRAKVRGKTRAHPPSGSDSFERRKRDGNGQGEGHS